MSKRELVCPRCFDNLKVHSASGVDVDYCTECHGIWFDASELSARLGVKFEFKKLIPFSKVIPSEINCPVCQESMTCLSIQTSNDPIEIDLCRKCKGIWLDDGEYSAIRKSLEEIEKKGQNNFILNSFEKAYEKEYSRPSGFRPRPIRAEIDTPDPIVESRKKLIKDYFEKSKSKKGEQELFQSSFIVREPKPLSFKTGVQTIEGSTQLSDKEIIKKNSVFSGNESALEFYKSQNFNWENDTHKIEASTYFICLFTCLPCEVFNPRKRFPVFLASFIVSCVLIFYFFNLKVDINPQWALEYLNYFSLKADILFETLNPLPLIKYGFMHGSLLHLLLNMYILWIFGDNVSDVFSDHGRVKGELFFALFFFITVIISGLGHVFACMWNPLMLSVPLVGASGGVSGVMAAYWRLFPKSKLYQILFFYPFKVPVGFYMIFWIGSQILLALNYGVFSKVSWAAHLAGFVAGYFLLPLFLPFKLKDFYGKKGL